MAVWAYGKYVEFEEDRPGYPEGPSLRGSFGADVTKKSIELLD